MENQEPIATEKDFDHLRSLAMGHKVMAGLLAVAPCCFIPHTYIGYSMVTDPSAFAGKSGTGPPPQFGAIFLIAGLAFMCAAVCMAILTYSAGKQIEMRKGWKFIFVVNALLCLVQPIGTILGILTLIVINRSSVKALFDVPEPSAEGS